MSAFSIIQQILIGAKPNGHALGNQKNITALSKAKTEIEKILKGKADETRKTNLHTKI